MPVKCYTKKTKKGKSYTTCSSPGKKKKKKRRTKKEVSEARSMGKEDKPKRKNVLFAMRKKSILEQNKIRNKKTADKKSQLLKGGARRNKKIVTKKKSAIDEMVSAYENQARGLEPDIYSIIDQGLRDLDSQASSVVVERPNQLGRQPSNSYWDDPIENDTPAYIQSVQGDLRDRALLEEAEGNIPENAPGGQIQLTGGTGRHMYYGADRMVLWGKKEIGQTETLTASIRNSPPRNIMPNSSVEERKKNPKMKRGGRKKGSKNVYRGGGLIGAGISMAYQRDNLSKISSRDK
mgnify:FL=1